MASSINEILEAILLTGIDLNEIGFSSNKVKDIFKPKYDTLCLDSECMSVQEMECTPYKELKEFEIAKKEAQESGENILYGQVGLLPCREEIEECNWDVVYLYVAPNGKCLAKRCHTF